MGNPDKARERLDDILSQKEYQAYYEENRNFIQILWDRITEWFYELLAEWFSDLEPSNAFADTLLVILIGVVILLAVVVIFFVVRAVRRKRTAQAYQPFQSADELEWSVERHVKEAEKQADAGDYSLGIRHQFLALLLYFHDLDLLKAHIWKTNWDYFAELQKRDKQRAEAFYELARTFDEAVYGERQMTKEEYVHYRKNVSEWMQKTGEKEIREG